MISKRLSVEDLIKAAADEMKNACDSAAWEIHVKRAEPLFVALLALIRAQDNHVGIHEEVRECTLKM